MDTVNLQKVQQLNERIAQTIEALNQLRISMQGVQQTPTQWGQGWQPWQSYATPFTPYTTPPWGTPSWPTPTPTPAWGIQHSPPSPAWGIQHSPPSLPQTHGHPTPGWTTPWTAGISHSSWDPSWQQRASWDPSWQRTTWDPTWQTRGQWPFVSWW